MMTSSRLMLALSNLSATSLPNVLLPVIGGHAGIIILPLFSQATPKANLLDENIKALTIRTQHCATEALKAWNMKVLDTLAHFNVAWATFACACLKGLNELKNLDELENFSLMRIVFIWLLLQVALVGFSPNACSRLRLRLFGDPDRWRRLLVL